MDTIFYVVSKIDGDYAYLQRVDDDSESPKLVARALLPDGIEEGSELKYEMFEYSMN